jgi:pentatricopeptide repeat protein
MFHLRSIVIAAAVGFTIIIQPCQSFFKQLSTFISPLRPLHQFDSRQDVVVKSWSRKDAESSEFPKDQSVRKLLDMLNSRSISSREAKRSFESILSNWQDFHLSEIGWHRLLDGAIRWRYPSYAISSFEIMTEQGIVCPAYLMTSLLQLICISGFQDVALSLFDSGVAAGLEPSVHCFSPLLKSCGTAQKARELLQRMEFVGIQANVISYTAAIKSCENTGDWRSALELLDLMRASGVNANEITYCCAINVASRGNAGDIAVNILREMLSLGFPPNLLCYGSALTGCAKVHVYTILLTVRTLNAANYKGP